MKYAAKLAGSGVVLRIQGPLLGPAIPSIPVWWRAEVYSASLHVAHHSLCAGARLYRFIARHYEGLASHGARNSLCKAHEVFVSIIALLRRPWRVLRLAQR
jgi:hypothetical protein